MITPQVVPATSHGFKKGMALVIEGESKRVAATILTTTQKKLGLELFKPTSPSFQVGEQVRLIYWDDEPVAYYWSGEVLQVGGPGKRHLVISLLEGRIEKRKFLRFRIPINFSFTVVEAADASLVGKHFSSETQDISLCGLAFDTFTPLKTGDRLEMNLHLSPSQTTNVVATDSNAENLALIRVTGTGIALKKAGRDPCPVFSPKYGRHVKGSSPSRPFSFGLKAGRWLEINLGGGFKKNRRGIIWRTSGA